MKKICVVIITIVTIFLVGCGCEHEWSEATCTEPMTCCKCGETEGEALGHIPGEWKISQVFSIEQKSLICSRCGKVIETESRNVKTEGHFDNVDTGLTEVEQEIVSRIKMSITSFFSPESVRVIKVHGLKDGKYFVSISAQTKMGGDSQKLYELSETGIQESAVSENMLSTPYFYAATTFKDKECSISAINSELKKYYSEMGWD